MGKNVLFFIKLHVTCYIRRFMHDAYCMDPEDILRPWPGHASSATSLDLRSCRTRL